MKLSIPTISLKFIKPKLILIILFLVLLGIEGYLLYYKVYGNLSTGIDDISIDNSVVRLDLAGYKTTLDLLDANNAFVAPPLVTNNPFK